MYIKKILLIALIGVSFQVVGQISDDTLNLTSLQKRQSEILASLMQQEQLLQVKIDSLNKEEGLLDFAQKSDETALSEKEYKKERNRLDKEIETFTKKNRKLAAQIKNQQEKIDAEKQHHLSITEKDTQTAKIDEKAAVKMAPDCYIAIEEDRRAKSLSNELSRLLSYTPSNLEGYFRDESYLDLNVGLKKVDDNYYLKTKFVFKSKDIKKSYGIIKKNEFLRLQLISGIKIFLLATNRSNGSIQEYTGNTVYEVDYMFSQKSDVDVLEKGLLDSVGVMYTSGFEEYVVFNVDLLQKQLACLKDAEK